MADGKVSMIGDTHSLAAALSTIVFAMRSEGMPEHLIIAAFSMAMQEDMDEKDSSEE